MEYTGRIVRGRSKIQSEYSPFLSDEARISPSVPELLYFPETTEEVSRALAECTAEGMAVTVSGGRTGIGGGAVPSDTSTALISLEHLQPRVAVNWNKTHQTWSARVGAGLKLQDFLTILKQKRYTSESETPAGLFFPVDPTETSATLGGMAATNASGARTLYYGAMRKWVLGLTAVLADGTILNLRRGEHVSSGGSNAGCGKSGILTVKGTKADLQSGGVEITIPLAPVSIPPTKHTAGYYLTGNTDAVDLFIGSEGTLGIITELELRIDLPGQNNMYTVVFLSEDNPSGPVRTLLNAAGLPPVALEYMDSFSLKLLREFRAEQGEASGVPELPEEAKAVLYLEYNFAEKQEAEQGAAALAGLLHEAGLSPNATWAGFSFRTLTAMKKFRHALPERVNSIIAERKQTIPELTKIGTDMAVPVEELEEMLREYREMLLREKLDFCIFGHIGNGHVHVNILPKTVEEMKLGWDAYVRLARSVRQKNGSICAEHGIGRLKRKLLPIQFTKTEIEVMKKVKKALDPEHRLNPGVLFPEETDTA